MTRVPVISEAMLSVGYDPKKQILEIEFHDGDVYQYMKVPADRHAALMSTPSHGHYFQEFIREHYPYRKLSGEPSKR